MKADGDFSSSYSLVSLSIGKYIGFLIILVTSSTVSKDKFGSHKDRHEILGQGFIWKDPTF